MIKKISIFICISFYLVSFVSAQEKWTLKIVYDHTHIRDTITQFIHREEMCLRISKFASLYNSQTKETQDSIRIKAFANAESNGGVVNLGTVKPTTPESFYSTISDKKIFTIVNFQRNNYIITDPIESINWKILQMTKKIMGYNCQKAICTFKGRNYEAWFTTDLPFSYGPWKLQGLPGLILEATDNRNQVSFTAKNIIKNPSGNFIMPSNGIKTTKNDFNKMMLAYANGARKDYLGNDEIKIEGVKIDGETSRKNIKKPMNNPIEKGN